MNTILPKGKSRRLSLDTVCALNRGVIWRDIDGMIVMTFSFQFYQETLPPGNNPQELYRVGCGNETLREIVGCLDGERSVRQIVALLAARYGQPFAKVKNDVVPVMQQMFAARVLVARSREAKACRTAGCTSSSKKR